MGTIQAHVDNLAKTAYNKDIAIDRKQQVGSGMRGDKIRTYRFQDDRVQDHLTGKAAKCSAVLKGNFELLWN
jgi:peptide chain release factor 1